MTANKESGGAPPHINDLMGRISRIETRVVNGFSQLGVDPCTKSDPQAMDIDMSKQTIYAHSPSLTIGTIMRNLNKVGAPQGAYHIHCDDCRELLFLYREVPDD